MKKKIDAPFLKDRIIAHTEKRLAEGQIAGATIQVRQDGQLLFDRHFGNVDDSTIFRMASMTKPLTVMAVLTQCDRGLLSLDDKVETYLPGFASPMVGKLNEKREVIPAFPAKTAPTIRMLLSHSSGIGCGGIGDIQAAAIDRRVVRTLADSVRCEEKMLLSFEPFTAQDYSAYVSFDVAARLVELTSGMEINRFLQENVCLPLGMTDTTFLPSAEQWKRITPMHTFDGEQCGVDPMADGCIFENIPATCCCSGAGLVSTAKDYAAFAEMLVNRGKMNEHQLINGKWIDEMGRSQLLGHVADDGAHWGLGVRTVFKEAGQILEPGSFGWSGAYGSHFWIDPVNHITAIYMKNSRYDGGAGAASSCELEQDVMDALRD